MYRSRYVVALAFGFLLASCGGGGGGGGIAPPPPALAQRAAVQSLAVAAAAAVTPEPQPPASKVFGSSWGRIAPYQVFDDLSTTGTAMSDQEIAQDAYRYPFVWGSFNPQPWRQANPSIYVSRYYVPEEDSNLMSGHTLAWWQQNHPDWILYACDSSGNPTHDIAYVPGIGFPDVPLDMHNPAVVHYQIYVSIIPFMLANGYNAMALDEVAMSDILVGGNPELGQQIVPGEYACGVWQKDGTFLKRYSSPNDPAFPTDMVNWIHTLHKAFHYDPQIASDGFKIIINHTVREEDSYETSLLSDVDMEMVEPGYSNYGSYSTFTNSSFFVATLNWIKWVQSHKVAMAVIDKFSGTTVTPDQLEFSIATYLLGNEGAEYLFTSPRSTPGTGYGAEQWHNEYATQLGKPCAESYAGPASTPNLYYRRFQDGFVVANFGGPTQAATLPANHTYTDLEGRTVTNPLPVTQDDAWVLVKTDGVNGCL